MLAARSLRHPLRAAAIGIALAAIGLSVLLLYPRDGGTSPVAIDGVSQETLVDEGITISPLAVDYRPGVGSDVAEEFANRRYPNVDICQTVLVRFTRSISGEAVDAIVDRPVWAINLDPRDPDLIPEGIGGETEFVLIFVDAETGEFIFGLTHTSPPAGGWGPDIGPARHEGAQPEQ